MAPAAVPPADAGTALERVKQECKNLRKELSQYGEKGTSMADESQARVQAALGEGKEKPGVVWRNEKKRLKEVADAEGKKLKELMNFLDTEWTSGGPSTSRRGAAGRRGAAVRRGGVRGGKLSKREAAMKALEAYVGSN